MIDIIASPIDIDGVMASVRHANAGANLLFLGTTREMTGDAQTAILEYESHRPMALLELERLATEARTKWELLGVAVVHRVGEVPIGEASVAIAVSAAHRREAFDAGQWLIDELKRTVPIWKKERWADGRSEWIHPE